MLAVGVGRATRVVPRVAILLGRCVNSSSCVDVDTRHLVFL